MDSCQETEVISYVSREIDPILDSLTLWRPRGHFVPGNSLQWYGERESRESADPLQQSFKERVQRWKQDTQFSSSSTEIVLHPAYQDIIAMGPSAIPLVLKELEECGGKWFWALRHLTGQNPIPLSEQGKIRRMTEIWLAWGRQHNYL